MSSELAPRVGDRVIAKIDGVTRIGTLTDFDEKQCGPDEWAEYAEVDLDGGDFEWVLPMDLTVVDREPAQWPAGWRNHQGRRVWVGIRGDTSTLLSRQALDKVVTDGPYILEHWDELMGES